MTTPASYEKDMREMDAEEAASSDSLDCLVSLPDKLIAKALCEAAGKSAYEESELENVWAWQDHLERVEDFKRSINFYRG